MVEQVTLIEERRRRREEIERAILLYRIDPCRYAAARILARIMSEAGAGTGAVHWSHRDDPERHQYPHIVIGAGSSLVSLLIGHDPDRRTWTLGLSGRRVLPTDFMLGQLAGFVAMLAPEPPRTLRLDATPAEWVMNVVVGYAGFGWKVERNLPAVVGRQLEGQAERASAQEAPFVRAIGAAVRAQDIGRVGGTLMEYGRFLQEEGRLEESAAIFALAYEAAIHLVDTRLGATAARLAGMSLRRLGRFDDSFRWYGQAQEIARHEDDLSGLAHAIGGAAFGHIERGATPKAREMLLDALRIAIASGDLHAIGVAQFGASHVEQISGNLTAAASHAWRAAQAYPSAKYQTNSFIQLASVLVECGLLDMAERAYTAALYAVTEPSTTVLTLDALAYVSALRGDAELYDVRWANVERHMDAAVPREAVQIRFYRAKALAHLGRRAEAEAAHAECIRFARAHGFLQYSERSEIELEQLPVPPVRDSDTERIEEWLEELVGSEPR